MESAGRRRTGLFILFILVILAALGLLALRLFTAILVNRSERDFPPAAFVSVGDVRLHYVEAGEGRPVVFIPGGGGTAFEFTRSPLYDPAVAAYHAWFIDRPGLGYSERPSGVDMTPAAQARLIHEAMLSLGVERPVLVGAGSWGGVIALAYALDYPQDVAGVVLLGSAPYPLDQTSEPIYARLIRVPVLGQVIANTVYVPLGRYVVAPLILRDAAPTFAPLPEVPTAFREVALGPELRPSHALSDAEESVVIPASLPDLSRRLVGVEVPVIVVSGSQDQAAVEQSDQLSRDMVYSEVQIVDGAGHYLWYSRPYAVLSAVQDAWDRADERDNRPPEVIHARPAPSQ